MSALPDSTLRRCDKPGCKATFDVAAVFAGTARADGWRTSSTFSLHLCPEHSHVWSSSAHVLRSEREGEVLCSCNQPIGRQWFADSVGDITTAYIAHLETVWLPGS